MRTMFRSILGTLTRGLFVLVPFIILIYVLLKGLGLVASITTPLATRLGLGGPGSRLVVLLFEVAIMAGLCLIAGYLLRAQWFKRVVTHSEELVVRIAQMLNYVDKIKVEALQKYDGKERRQWNTALVMVDGAWVVAFEMERTPTGLITLFIPEAPNADRGSVRCVNATEVDLRPVPEAAALAVLKAHGKGLNALLAAHPKP